MNTPTNWILTDVKYLYSRIHKNKTQFRVEYNYYFNGKRYKLKRTLKAVNKRHAIKELNQLIADADAGKILPKSIEKERALATKQKKKTITPAMKLEDAIAYLRDTGTDSMKKHYNTVRLNLEALPMWKLPLEKIELQHLEELRNNLNKSKRKEPTFVILRSFISQALKKAKLYNVFEEFGGNNVFKSTAQPNKSLLDYKGTLSNEELARRVYNELLKIEDGDKRLILLLTFMLGKRINEIHSLRRKDIDIKNETVTIIVSKQRYSTLEVLVPLPDEVKNLLDNFRPEERLAKRNTMKPYSRLFKMVLANALKCDVEELKHIGVHSARQIALSTITTHDPALETTADKIILNHATGGMLRYYSKPDFTLVKKIYNIYWKLLRPRQ